jgi:hypothetical protein
MDDERQRPGLLRRYWKGHYLRELGDAAIQAFLTGGEDGGGDPALPAGSLQSYGGAIAAVGDEETAFGHRDALVEFVAVAAWTDPAQDQPQMAAARRSSGPRSAVRPARAWMSSRHGADATPEGGTREQRHGGHQPDAPLGNPGAGPARRGSGAGIGTPSLRRRGPIGHARTRRQHDDHPDQPVLDAVDRHRDRRHLDRRAPAQPAGTQPDSGSQQDHLPIAALTTCR